MAEKPRFVMCFCTGECPGFQELNLWRLINRVRNELGAEYAIIHPQLCVDDGDRFRRDYAKPDYTYIIGGCDPCMQRKMFKDVIAELGGTSTSRSSPLTCATCPPTTPTVKVADAVGGLG